MHQVTCPRCEGKGKTPIGDHLEDVLACFPKLGHKTAEDIADRLNISAGAASNRLMDLFLIGLVDRERDGKYWLYSRNTQPKGKK